MKKNLTVLFAMMILSVSAFADQRIDPTTLPANIREAVKGWYPNATVMFAEADWDSYEVALSNGAEIDFRKTGDWKQIECMAGVPASAVPEKIAAEIAKKFPDIPVVKIEKEYRGYEVKLQNRMELYFNEKGKLIGQKYDD